MKSVKLAVSAIAIVAATGTAAFARDNIQVAGSSTVLPYASIVAEAFGENFDFPTPVVESGGSSSGLKRFCEGVGENTIDVANASRKIKDKEIATCAENGVTDIMEVRIGYDGIVFASQKDGPAFDAFNPADIYNALGAKVMKDGQLVDNTYAKWNEFNSALPDADIIAFIPGTKHGTREVFEEKVLEAGCEATGAMEAYVASGMDEKAAAKECMKVRTDGKAVDIDGDYTETLARIGSNPNGIGVFGLAFYENNTDKLKVATMSGVSPSTETIASGDYPVSRPLFFYVKKAHIGQIPGLKEYAEFFVSDDMAGADGPLAQYGLVSDPELAKTQEAVAAETTMNSGM
ncbi:MAG: substrate-binding domain-containing protein [Thioclava marina]|jgi:phosphate ABC transporter substrate-binding protein, PhoT family (TC 3.A.1.7.1)|uniref:Phosphonate ABC transporter substrate-binding protein n=1 Tax=Thioclava marina TaxID=1915077 RepID=A0ABX3MQX9_9RHOB|nr:MULTISPECIES: substrate-binding domain-containing protein [Thioclava]TNE85846.1 MAG: phosphonate ABC transporter substrate-binding protein [Paracoccaceae bacterium]MBC7144349.1 substrate-binding domain-containing protein [Thioclava marina]MBD3801942.1 substrate-binding domain-containing protein [Thioclava sp.]OOY13852.1 phosphonate ABC transporter substrate-binding protein [Thioclava marina]OOY29559.1 phosphonate ABC transporter substrate-binding protein [Thioclava sp. L04-15]